VRNSFIAAGLCAAGAFGIAQMQDNFKIPADAARMTDLYWTEKDKCTAATLRNVRPDSLPQNIMKTIDTACARKATIKAQSASPAFKAAELGVTTGAVLSVLFLMSAYLAFILPRSRFLSPPPPHH
jgi:hypothetical protein